MNRTSVSGKASNDLRYMEVESSSREKRRRDKEIMAKNFLNLMKTNPRDPGSTTNPKQKKLKISHTGESGAAEARRPIIMKAHKTSVKEKI